MTAEERIEKEAEDFSFQVPYDGTDLFYNEGKYLGYIAGAITEKERYDKLWKEYQLLYGNYANHDRKINELLAQLKEERNKAIDECMAEIERLNDDGVLYESTARKVLEFLKSDSK